MRKYSMAKVLTALCNKGYLDIKGVSRDVKYESISRKLKAVGTGVSEVFYNYFKTEYPALYSCNTKKIRDLYKIFYYTGMISYYDVYPTYLVPKKLSTYVEIVFKCFVHVLSNKEQGLPECTHILDKCSSDVQRAIRNLGFDNDAEIKKFIAKPVGAVALSDRGMKELMYAYSVRSRLGKLNTVLDYAKATWESGLMETADKDMYDRYLSNGLSKYHTYEGASRALDFSYNYTRHLFETYMSSSVLQYTRKHHRSMSAEDLSTVLDYLYVGSDLGEYLGDWDMQLRTIGVTSAESVEEFAMQVDKSVEEASVMLHRIFEDIFPVEKEEEDRLFITLNAHLKHALIRGGVYNDEDVVNFLERGSCIRNVGVKSIEKLKEVYAEKLK